jgi:hypothetical protein
VAARRKFAIDSPFFCAGNMELELLAKQVCWLSLSSRSLSLLISLHFSISFLNGYRCHGDPQFWNLMDLNIVKGQMDDGKISEQHFFGNWQRKFYHGSRWSNFM